MNSRKYRYNKNNPSIINDPPSRNQAPNRRGHAQQFGNGGANGYSQHDNRYDSRPIRGGASRGRGKFSRAPRDARQLIRGSNNNNNLVLSTRPEDQTYKVTIPGGAKYQQLYLIGLLRENLGDSSIAFYNYQTMGTGAVFYVMGNDNSEALKLLSKRIQDNNGNKILIITVQAPLPSAPMNPEVQARVKEAMGQLYDPSTKVMNLSNFRDAEVFKQHGLFVVIGKANVIRTIVDIILQSPATPVCALNLSNNKINYLEGLKPLVEQSSDLKAIDLSRNKIHSIDQIKHLSSDNIVELVLEDNPFINEFSSRANYISAIRKLFSNLRKLDNEDLPDAIGFDIVENEKLPETVNHCIPPEVNAFVYQFLEAYYKIFDSDNRQGLLQAYHDSAMFTYSFAKHDSSAHKLTNDQLVKDSHNLLRLRDEALWVKLVKTSNVDIVSYLNKFPNTQHKPESFRIDVPFYEPSFAIIVVNGLYTETFKKDKPMRSFSRTFCIVPQNTGFVVVNDMLQIANPSTKQTIAQSKAESAARNAAKQQRQSDRMMADVAFNSNNIISASALSSIPSTSTQQLISNGVVGGGFGTVAPNNPHEDVIGKFMQVTNMNREFSIKCLEENGFDAEKAYSVFMTLQANNAIPAEAFIK